MNKTDLIEMLSTDLELTKARAGETVDAVLGAITKALKRGDEVSLVGFGTFKSKHRAARKGRNPKTGAEISIAASNSVGFKQGKALKDAVN